MTYKYYKALKTGAEVISEGIGNYLNFIIL